MRYSLAPDYQKTTKRMPIMDRLYIKFLYPLELYWNTGSLLVKLQRKRNIPFSDMFSTNTDISSTRNLFEIYNNLFADNTKLVQSVDPRVETIGPMLQPLYYDSLPLDIQEFLADHNRTVFVQFDHSNGAPNLYEMEKVLAELLHMQETEFIDGLIWSFGAEHSYHHLITNLPAIITRSGSVYNISSLWNQQCHNIRLLSQTSQRFSVLEHSSIITFVTYDNAMATLEALYAGKRVVIIKPYFWSQPVNTDYFLHQGLGRCLNIGSYSGAVERTNDFEPLRDAILDPNGTIQNNVERYKALLQIHPRYRIARGADLVERVLFTSTKDGCLSHGGDGIEEHFSFLKENDYDLYIYILISITCCVWVVRYVYLKILRAYYILLLVNGKINKVKLP